MPSVGEIWKYRNFYIDEETGKPLPKYFLIVGFDKSSDIVYKLLTSRENNRNTVPACSHGFPYPSYFMGVIQPNGELDKPTWVDLRESEEIDNKDFDTLLKNSTLDQTCIIPKEALPLLLECVAHSEDITRRQRAAVLEAKGSI